jgi:hypothetical protein
MKKKSLLIIFFLATGLFIFSTLFLYYRGNRNNFINRAVNNFSSNNKELAIELKKLTKILDGLYIFHQFINSDIPTYSLTIKPTDLLFLNSNLPKEDAHLTAEYKKFVEAEFEDQGTTYKVKVRYRGDNENHWRFSKKSWRIKFDDNFQNQETVNLILPEDRYFFIEPWIAHMGKKLGLILPEFSYVNLKVNGQLHGVYLKSEHWGEAFLSNHQLSTDADLYGEAEFSNAVPNLYLDVKNFQKYTYDPSKKKNDVNNLETLLNLLNHASNEEFFNTIPNLIDVDNFLHWQAQSTLAFSHSQKISHNLILYFNPEINKFQFIPWNVAMADEEPVYPDTNYNPLMTRILSNPEYMFKRNQIMWHYINDQEKLADDLSYFDNLYQNTRGSFYRDSLKIFPNLDFDLTVKKHRRRIIAAQNKIKELLNDSKAKIQLIPNPDLRSNILAYLEIESSGFASLQLVQVSFPFKQTANFSLFVDSNQNNQLDISDENIGQFHQVDNQYMLNPKNILIHTNRDTQTNNQPFLLKPTKQNFFLVTTSSILKENISDIKNGKVKLKNSITDKIVSN